MDEQRSQANPYLTFYLVADLDKDPNWKPGQVNTLTDNLRVHQANKTAVRLSMFTVIIYVP